MPELTLLQILNRTENIGCTKEYTYNEQAGIGGKPSIVAGGENLRRFSLTIKLHSSFCNPKKIIDDIEQKAENREIINYFQLDEYIGDFVIERFNKNIVQTYKDMIIYAEIGIDIVEHTDSITYFEEQTKTTPVTENIVSSDDNMQILTTNTKTVAEKLKSSSSKLANFINNQSEKIKNNVFTNVTRTIQTGDIKGLTDIGVLTLNSLQSAILDEIKTAGVTQAIPIVNKYIDGMGSILDEKQREILQTELLQIPDRLIKNALRG